MACCRCWVLFLFLFFTIVVHRAGGAAVADAAADALLPSGAVLSARIAETAEYVLSAQDPLSGAVLLAPWPAGAPPSGRVVPYFAHLACARLLSVVPRVLPVLTARVLDAARAWILWYAAHQNAGPDRWGVAGTCYDWDVFANGTEAPTFDYDSSDSYAATFLTLAGRFLDAGGDEATVRGVLPALSLAEAAVRATMQPDSLTWAKPAYHEKYTMDNVEVACGLASYAALLERLGNATEAARVRGLHTAIDAAVDALLWDSTAGGYRVAAGSAGADWGVFYAGVTASLWPTVFGLPSAARHRGAVWAALQASPTFAPWQNLSADPGGFPWTSVNCFLTASGATAAAAEYDARLEARFQPIGWVWPFHVAEAGFRLQYLGALYDASSSGATSASAASAAGWRTSPHHQMMIV